MHGKVSKYIIQCCLHFQRFLNFLLPHQFHKVFIAFSWPILRIARPPAKLPVQIAELAGLLKPLQLPFVHHLISQIFLASLLRNKSANLMVMRSQIGNWV